MEKFKAGDTVEAIKSYLGEFTKGRSYTVSEHSSSDLVFVEKDDKGSTNNGWSARNFKLVSPPASQSPIRTRREIVLGVCGVVRIDKGANGFVFDLWKANANADELREAAHLFNQIAEVLEENAG